MKMFWVEQRDALRATFAQLRKSTRSAGLVVLLDVLFLLLYGFLTSPLFQVINNYFYEMGGIVTQAAPGYTTRFAEQPGLLKLVFTDPSLSSYAWSLVGIFLLLLVIIYVIYVVLQGMAWKVAQSIAGKDIKSYVRRFAEINLFWFGFLVVYRILHFASELRFVTMKQFQLDATVNYPGIVLFILLLVGAYFAIISYVVGSNKKAWVVGRTQAKHLVPSFVLVAVFIALVDVIVVQLAPINSVLALIVGALLLFPGFVAARVFFTIMISRRLHGLDAHA